MSLRNGTTDGKSQAHAALYIAFVLLPGLPASGKQVRQLVLWDRLSVIIDVDDRVIVFVTQTYIDIFDGPSVSDSVFEDVGDQG